MPRIEIPTRDQAPAESSQAILDNVNQVLGFVPNLQRLMSISPNALGGWAALMGSLSKTLDVKTRDGIALAVSEADGCAYCLAAHELHLDEPCEDSSRGDRPQPRGSLRRRKAAIRNRLCEGAYRETRQGIRRGIRGGEGGRVD